MYYVLDKKCDKRVESYAIRWLLILQVSCAIEKYYTTFPIIVCACSFLIKAIHCCSIYV